jgi:enoyl-CoA hydratase/carnithine racemase
MGEALKDRPPPPPAAGRRMQGFLALADAVGRRPKPVIAAINGLCMARLRAVARLRPAGIARPGRRAIGLAEDPDGIFPGGGGTQRLRGWWRGQGRGDHPARA